MSDMAIEPKRRIITVFEYHRMVEAGVLHEGERLELLDGIIVEMSPLGGKHAALHLLITDYLKDALRGRAAIAGQISVPLGDLNEPQPDIAILAPKAREYYLRRPTLEEFFALIEIADSSLTQDTGKKRDLYARFGIAEYLVVDVVGRKLLRFVNPRDNRFEAHQELSYGDSFHLGAIPEIDLEADAFLPPPDPV